MNSWFPSFITAVSAIIVSIVEAKAAKERKQDKAEREAMEKEKVKSKAVEDGVLALLRDRIIGRYNHYTDNGYIPIYGLENVLSMYNAYHMLGGNGTITDLVNDLRDLPHEGPDKK